MKKLTITIIALALFSVSAMAQDKDEQEIMKIHQGLEQAYVKRDIAPFEAALSAQYTFSGPNGKAQSRDELFKEMRDEIAKPSFKTISEQSDNIKIRVMGDTAFVTSGWTSVAQGLAEGAEPHTDKGQYTGIYEKMDGKWMLVREVFTEAQHDRKAMEAEVLKASNAYDAIMKSRDKAAYERMLAPDYTYTNDDGKLISRADDIAHFGSVDTVIGTVEASDKKVRVIGNNAAVETGIYRLAGTNKGKPFDETSRYTTTWVWKDMRWQISADHTSAVKK
jgi:ketosteroid isomerase-like protein